MRGNEHWTGMSRISDFFPPRRLTALARLLAATSVAALLAGPATAGPTDPVAQVDPLISGSTQLPVVQGAAPQDRKPQAAQAARNDLTANGQQLDTPLPAYEPVSPGPVDPTAAKPTKRSSALDVLDEETTTQPPKSAAARRRALATKAARAADNAPTPTPRPKTTISTTATDGSSTTDGTTTGTVRAPKMTADEIPPVDKRAERELPIEGLTPLPDENPFAPVGVRVGSFILRPSLEQGVTATSNADSSATGESAILSETTLRLNAVSDWSRHSATLDAYGTFRKSLSGQELKDTSAGLDATVGLDFSEDLRGLLTAGYARRPDSASSPVVIVGTASQPTLETFKASAGLSKDVGKLRFGVTGRIEHDRYGDADLEDGTVLSQKERDSTLYTVALRGGYEVSPALVPFVEVEVGQRRYDQTVDTAGYRRSSDRLGARAGVALDLDQKLTGEISAGWIREGFKDDRLSDISGASVDADLRWSLERGTSLALAASTVVEGSTTPGASGSLLNTATLTLEREIRANLTANAAIGGGYRNYTDSDGHDQLFNAQIGATYWLNRYAGITGRLRYESLKSNLPGRDYDASSAFLGLKLQR
jgi:hypothetical protein